MKQIGLVFISLSSLLASAGAVFAADAALVEAAKKEGHVTWYTVQIVDQIVRPIISGFERKYGMHVDYVRANSAQLAVRLSNEAKARQGAGERLRRHRRDSRAQAGESRRKVGARR